MSNKRQTAGVVGLVTRRPSQRPLPTGLLSMTADGFSFAYVDGFASDPEERPLLGFSDPARVYRSPLLFPFFQQRVVQADRSDRVEFLRWLDLPQDASDWQMLERSGGTRKGDRYELVSAPETTPSDGTDAHVLARGLRFIGHEIGLSLLESSLERLAPGAPLIAQVENGNPVNPAARRLLTEQGTPVGWLPDVLVSYIAPSPADPVAVSVARVNGPETPWHLRLLIHVQTPVRPPLDLFDSPQWQPASTTRPNAAAV